MNNTWIKFALKMPSIILELINCPIHNGCKIDCKSMIYLIKYLNTYYLLNTSYFISQKTAAFIHIAMHLKSFRWHTYLQMYMCFRRLVSRTTYSECLIFPSRQWVESGRENLPFFVFVVSCRSLGFCDWSAYSHERVVSKTLKSPTTSTTRRPSKWYRFTDVSSICFFVVVFLLVF